MNCEDFLRQFRDALDGKVSESVIQENVRYYRSYISSQTAGGKSESEVLGMLGDPRLLAKTIEESSRFASGKDSQDGYAGTPMQATPVITEIILRIIMEITARNTGIQKRQTTDAQESRAG